MTDQPTTFSQNVQQHLKSYVYVYIDPRDRKIFYIGQGKNNRVFDHASDPRDEARKVQVLQQLAELEIQPQIEILRHGLSADEAKLVEAVCIDLLGLDNLTNELKGKHSQIFGRTSIERIIQRYDATPADVTEKCVAININQTYKPDMTERELYECVRGIWPVGPDRDKADYALAIFQGVILEVYKISRWFEGGAVFSERKFGENNRYEFVGNVDAELSKKYKGKSLPNHFKKGARFPVQYLNIKGVKIEAEPT
jgi:uncharacterized protein